MKIRIGAPPPPPGTSASALPSPVVRRKSGGSAANQPNTPGSTPPPNDPVGDRLRDAGERLNEELEAYEQALRDLRLGVRANVTLRTRPLDGTGDVAFDAVTFMKSDGSWQLLYVHGVEGDPDTFRYVPLTKASRGIRVLASEKLEELFEKLEEGAEESVAKVEAAAARVRALTRRVRARRPA